ncbi:MAG: hypothetical protein Q9208_003281 [Pyrenodesmia sp. 3 TL-2023]
MPTGIFEVVNTVRDIQLYTNKARHDEQDTWLSKQGLCRDFATPSPKRQRSMRTSAGRTMNYDMKYHPMDDVLRPAASAARKAAHGLDTCASPTTSESTAVGEEDDDTEDSESPKLSPQAQSLADNVFESPQRRPIRPRAGSPSNRRVTRAEAEGERPVMYDMKHHPVDIALRPAAARRAIAKWAQGHDQKPAKAARKNKMRNRESRKHAKLHAADEAPSAAASDGAISDELTEVPSTTGTYKKPEAAPSTTPLHEAISDESIPISPSTGTHPILDASGYAPSITPLNQAIPDKSITMPSSDSTPAAVPQTSNDDLLLRLYPRGHMTDEVSGLGWKSLSRSDRLLYLLRQGEHDFNDNSMHSWAAVALKLRKHIGLDKFPSIAQGMTEGEALRYRYHTVFHHLNHFFEAETDSATQDDQTYYYAEDFDVYDLEPGDKYFRYKRDSVVQPRNTHSMDTTTLRQVGNNTNVRQVRLTSSCRQCLSDRLDKTAGSIYHHSKAPCSHEMASPGMGPTEREAARIMMTDEQSHKVTPVDEERNEVHHSPINDSESTDDEATHGLDGSYNDEAAYIRQAMGLHDTYSPTQASPERDVLESMRNDIVADIDTLDLEELTTTFLPSAHPGALATKESDSFFGLSDSRRSRRSRDGSIFSVHEDQPGNTPRIQRQISMNPKSPGTDVPKENLQERSASEEIQVNQPD